MATYDEYWKQIQKNLTDRGYGYEESVDGNSLNVGLAPYTSGYSNPAPQKPFTPATSQAKSVSSPTQDTTVQKPTSKVVMTSGSSSSGSDSGDYSSTTTSSTDYTKPLPGTPEARTFEAPEYDERKVAKLTQQQAAPGIRSLRNTVQQAMNTNPQGNPNANRMTLRDALAGYGQGLENVMSGAGGSARNMYNQEYSTDVMESQTNFSALQRRDELEFNSLMDEWRGSAVKTLTTNRTDSELATDSDGRTWKDVWNTAKRNNTSGYDAIAAWNGGN